MDDFTIRIIEGTRLLTAEADALVLGSRHDSGAQRLIFVRPEKFIGSELVLYFTSGEEEKTPINIGTDNEFVLTGDLTGSRELWVQLSFVSNGGETVEFTNRIRFLLRETVTRLELAGEPPSNQVGELRRRAFVQVENSGSELIFRNIDGEECGGAAIVAGGGASVPEWYIGKNLLVLGDSIAELWADTLRDKMQAASRKSVAKSGAKLADLSGTVHNGDPASSSDNNTMSNQFLQLKAQKTAGTYSVIPDVIVIAFGTNNDSSVGTLDIEPAFTRNGYEYYTLDSLNLVGNIPASLRWTVEQLRADGMYPNARIFICSPPQTANGIRTATDIKHKADCIRLTANRLGVGYEDAYGGSGIYGPYENYQASGRYLSDGLHPNTAGIDVITDTIIAAMKNDRDTDGATALVELTANTRINFAGDSEGKVLGVASDRLVLVPGSGGGTSGINYSEAAQLTGLLYTNDEPIYQKTVNIGNLPNAAAKSVAHGISGSWILRHELAMNLPYTPDAVTVSVDNQNVTVTTATNMSSISAKITLWYINASAVTLTNLAVNGSFTDGITGWSYGTNVLTANGNGTGTMTKAIATPVQSMTATKSIAADIPAGHVVYARGLTQGIFVIDGAPATPFRQLRLYLTTSSSAQVGVTSTRNTPETLVPQSSYGTLTGLARNVNIYASLSDSQNLEGTTITFGKMVVVDLTAAFGAGNEPEQAWCDANIPDFEGTISI